MAGALDALLDTQALTPHGFCLLWEPGLIWLHAGSDAVIALTYYSIPLALAYFVYRRSDLAFGWIIWLFAGFILACGTTHVLAVITLWKPYYWLDGAVKLVTAILSLITAVALWPLIPRALAVPSPDELRDVNLALERQIMERDAAAIQLRASEEQLRQSQKMEAVGQLTGGLAHDFNNLLIGITGSLELLQIRLEQGRLADLDRYIFSARGAATRAAALTHRLLAFSRRQTLDPKIIDINHLVAGIEELIRRTVGPAIAVEVISGAGPLNALVDPNQLEAALLNLCINARDAMPDGGRLTIETSNRLFDERDAHEQELAPGQYVSLSVSDSGVGMTKSVIARAFDPFFTTKPLGQGTGLGLSMVHGFARQSGGQARIYSEVDRGTSVCIYLPIRHGDADDQPVDARPAEPAREALGATVLVVDDEPTVRMLVAEILEEIGCAAIEASDGASGLETLRSSERVDMLITDVGLPGGMNGRQLAEAARLHRPGLKVLFITGYAEKTIISDGQLEPNMEVLTKPFTMDVLASRIQRLMDKP